MRGALPPLVGSNDRIVLFDGVCKLCGAWARFLIRFDREHVFRLASVQSPEGKAILEWMGLPTDHFESMVLVEDNRAFLQSTAFIRVVARMPFPWPLAAVIWLIPSFIRNWLYDRVALNRYAIFGRHEACLLPTPDHERRFLSAHAGVQQTDVDRVPRSGVRAAAAS
ncbi:MAG TPA: thiol-disulfide oxidoreductase DCC family protein [Gammaproteobacteria bacterium]|nr:thiol-disulfide oxidoreductase DCC family protein [Gammaproteobacteria bacterium]